jgi:PKD domain
MSLAAAGFDSLYLAPEVIRDLLVALHSEGAISHHWHLDFDGRVIEGSVQPVQHCWIGTVPRRGSGRHPVETYPLMCDVSVDINVRNASRLGDEGKSGRAVAHLALLFEVPAHQGVVPGKFAHSVRLDFTSTVAADIEFPAGMDGDAAVQQAIVGLVHSTFSGTYPLPPGQLRDLSAQHPIQIVPVLTPSPQLVVRPAPESLDAAGRRLAQPPAEGVVFSATGQPLWQLVLAPERLLPLASRVIPPLLHRTWGRAALALGSAVVKGTLRDGGLDLDLKPASGRAGLVGVAVEAVPAHQGKLRWAVAPRSGNALAAQVVTTDDLGLMANTAMASVPEFKAPWRGITLTPERHQFRPSGLHVSGRLEPLAGPAPVAEFQWMRQPRSDLLVTFHAGRTWSPGRLIEQLVWDFGDGAVQTFRAPAIDIVVTHKFSGTGPFDVTLTVVDDGGRQATARRTVEPGKLRLACSMPTLAANGSLASRVRVLMGNAPARDAELTLHVLGGSFSARTDQDGFADLQGAFAPFAGPMQDVRPRRQRVGHAAELALSIGRRRLRVPTAVMDGDIFSAIVEATLACRQHAQLGTGAPAGSPASHLRRRALALPAALWRGDFPSWGAARSAPALEPAVGPEHIVALRHRVASMAERVRKDWVASAR